MSPKKFYIPFFVLIFVALAAFNQAVAGDEMGFSIKSVHIKQGERIERRFTCDGEDISPELKWDGVPEGTQSLVLIVEDPDAPMGTFIHWVVYDIPAALGGFETGASGGGALAEGISSFGRKGYNGPCPPRGHGDHRYYLRLKALDIKRLNVKDRANRADVEAAMNGHVLAETYIMGIYGR